MKAQVKRAFKAFFFSSSKKEKQNSRQALYEILFNPQCKCQEVFQFPQSQCPLFLFFPLFCIDYHANPLALTSGIEFSIKAVYPTMILESFSNLWGLYWWGWGGGVGGERGEAKRLPYQFFPCNFYKRRS